ncbi:MAG: class I SAM-dependent methyltransferase [Armatimonadota bacterium]
MTSQPDEKEQVSRFWDSRTGPQPRQSWWQLPRCLQHRDEMLTGSRSKDFVALLRETLIPQSVPLGVSFGSGGCQYEERIVNGGLAERMECWELSAERCRLARQRLEPKYGSRITVINDDLLASRYPPASVDLVYVHDALHHVRELERVLGAIAVMLKPAGVFVVDDFFGPTGMQWTEQQTRVCNDILAILPTELRRLVRNPSATKERVSRPDPKRLWEADPSECVRSSEMLDLLRERFAIVLDRPVGGAVFHPLLSGIAGNFLESETGKVCLEFILLLDRSLTQSGALNADYRFLACRPKSQPPQSPDRR